MARIRDFDRTRTLLISAASDLFAAQAYDRTSVDRIIRQAGVSKGAFYHHFSSKEEILDAVTASMVAEAMNEIRSAVAESTNATVRLNRFLNASRVWKLAHFGLLREVLAVLHRDENAPMLRKLHATTVAIGSPLLTAIIQQGIDEGVFDPPDPRETAHLILQMSSGIQEGTLRTLLELGLSEEALDVLQRRANLFFEMVERMLGARKGSIERLRLSFEELQSTAWDGADGGSTVKAAAK